MKAIPAKPITDAVLISSDVPEADHAAWSDATDYAVDDYCIVVATHTIYKCLVAHTHASPAYPPDNVNGTLPKWLNFSKTNRWKMFDTIVASTTSQAESIGVSLDASLCDTVALFNVIGQSVTFSLKADDETVLYEETINLFFDDYVDWADVFFKEPELRGNLYRTLPISFGTTLTVTIDSPGGTASCGHCVIGKGKFIGKSKWGLQLGVTDYSKKSINDYGEAYLAQGNFADTAECDIWLSNSARPQVKAFLTGIRATGIVWLMDNKDDNPDPDLVSFGFYEDLQIVVQGPQYSGCTLKVQGLV